MAEQTDHATALPGAVPVRPPVGSEHWAVGNSRWADRYLAIPFREGATGWEGADCWGLYALILMTEAGIGYPDIEASDRLSPASIGATVANQIARGAWIETPLAAIAALDCVVLRAPGLGAAAGAHVGCAIGGGRLIETSRALGPHVAALADRRVAGRIAGVFRPAALSEALGVGGSALGSAG